MVVDLCEQALVRCGARDGRLLVAVSGGLDSMALLAILSRLAPTLELELAVAHVNHQLRDEASEADERWVRRRAEETGLRFEARRVDPTSVLEGGASRVRPTLEEAARDLRRAALLEMADAAGAGWIATAHHMGDQAETLLLRILRGTGPDGLAGIAEQSADGRWLRPLLRVGREDLRAWAVANGVGWRDDASNEDRRFARNRLRLDWLPGLTEAFNPQLLRTLGDLAEAQGRDAEWIGELVAEAARDWLRLEGETVWMPIDGWQGLPEALARRLVRRALLHVGLGRDLTRTHLSRVLAFLARGRGVGRDRVLQLPGGYELRRRDREFELSRP